MSKQIVRKRPSENKYLHLGFHISLNEGLHYIADTYGSDAVDAYLCLLADRYYSPLSADLRDKGPAAMAAHLTALYTVEERAEVLHLEQTDSELRVRVDACPAVSYIKSQGAQPGPHFGKTTSILYARIAENAGYAFELDAYDPETGRAAYRFMKKEAEK